MILGATLVLGVILGIKLLLGATLGATLLLGATLGTPLEATLLLGVRLGANAWSQTQCDTRSHHYLYCKPCHKYVLLLQTGRYTFRRYEQYIFRWNAGYKNWS